MRLLDHKYLEKIAKFIESNYGVTVPDGKQSALQLKLERLMRRKQIHTLEELYTIITKQQDSDVYHDFMDAVTTHKTDFFRENDHFEFIKDNMQRIIQEIPRIKESKEIRIWSAACSTGEEPYTLAMVLSECVPSYFKIRILATDISTGSLRTAMNGIYSSSNVNTMPHYYRDKFFEPHGAGQYCVSKKLKDMVTFRSFNLLDRFPFKGSFDIILCRNVMIYFDNETQQNILDKMYAVTTENGYFIIGMSEGLLTKKQRYKYVQPSVYKKISS